MPLLYKKNNNPMKLIQDMTKEEAIFVINIQPRYSFFTEEAKSMINIVIDYYDSTQSQCNTCGSGLRQAKDSIIKLYAENKEVIDNKMNGIIVEVTINKKKKK